MNERIRELAQQQGLTGPNYLISSQELEKFAELIIKKCISQIALIGISNIQNEDIAWTVETAIDKIQEHFGVKE